MDICLEGDHFGTDMGATPLVNPPPATLKRMATP